MSREIEELDLLTKYRPRSLEEYEGNEYAKSVLMKSFNDINNLPPTMLIYGESGIGKTSIFRLLAKQVLCHCENSHEQGKFCGTCQPCKDFDYYIATGDADNIYNVMEVDATLDRGIDAIENLIQETSMSTLNGDPMLVLIDEAHYITRAGQNALLKTFEDAPPNVVYALATTDPDDIIPTLRNRCRIQLEIKKPRLEDGINLLSRVCRSEGIAFEKPALSLIVEKSNFVYRQSLVDLNLVVMMHGKVTVETVSNALDIQNTEMYFDFLKFLISKDLVRYTRLMHRIKTSVGYLKFLRGLSEFTSRGIYVLHGIQIGGLTEKEIKNIKSLFQNFTVEQIYGLLHFINSANVSDLENSLFLLGYRGLVLGVYTEPEVEKKVDPIPVRENSVSHEKKVLNNIERVDYMKDLEESSKRMFDDLESVDDDDILNQF